MNELSLFTGAGGGVLGSKILGWRTIGYVEYEKYCQEILKQRIADGVLDAAPIFGDVREFIEEGYARGYSGLVDVVTGGFPCQPFSVAGKGLGEADPRNMWPSTIECLRLVRPRLCFFENVPGLLSSGYFGRILSDLAASGYDARWTCLGADDVGANHRRKRLWILAYTDGDNNGWWAKQTRESQEISGINRTERRSGEFGRASEISADVADTENHGWQQCSEQKNQGGSQRVSTLGGGSWGDNAEKWWSIEPNVGRVAHGVARRVDRLKAIGNGQVPLAMARAFQILSQGII